MKDNVIQFKTLAATQLGIIAAACWGLTLLRW
jgi:hypothetical protein